MVLELNKSEHIFLRTLRTSVLMLQSCEKCRNELTINNRLRHVNLDINNVTACAEKLSNLVLLNIDWKTTNKNRASVRSVVIQKDLAVRVDAVWSAVLVLMEELQLVDIMIAVGLRNVSVNLTRDVETLP